MIAYFPQIIKLAAALVELYFLTPVRRKQSYAFFRPKYQFTKSNDHACIPI